MKEAKPEWYARLKKGPFEGDVFASELQRELEARAESGQPGRKRWTRRTGKTRLNIRTVALGAAAVLLIVLAALATSGRPFDAGRQASIGGGGEQEPLISFESSMDRLRLGMTQEEVRQALGSDYAGMSVRRDFPQEHREDPNDMSTWSAVDLWRYDFGVRNGYEVRQGEAVNDPEDGFDLDGIRSGEIEAQLIINWRDGKVERGIAKMRSGEGAIGTTRLGPVIEHDAPLTDIEKPPEADPTVSDSSSAPELPAPNGGIRAVGSSGSGQFQLRPVKSGDESVQTLGAPSCLGQETDVHFFGDYELFFHRPSGEEAVVQSFEQLEMIWKGKETLEFRQLDFADMELFLFLPRYTDCHALEFYAYGVDKATGEASNYTFRDGENDLPYWTTSPQELPKVKDGKLVVEGGRWAGQDGAMRYTFEPVPDKHQLRLVDEERIP
ncbi:hypothetical protein [Cohnella cellulosilytica]|uniref:DUF4179 domain-containing protein n=1 Tax=Cohnella cellulosilytica TaxID=986710 RepID=A0ABW2FM61_9BACL